MYSYTVFVSEDQRSYPEWDCGEDDLSSEYDIPSPSDIRFGMRLLALVLLTVTQTLSRGSIIDVKVLHSIFEDVIESFR